MDRILKNPSWWESPPEDPPECGQCGEFLENGRCLDCDEPSLDILAEPISDEPTAKDLEKDCDYWNRVDKV